MNIMFNHIAINVYILVRFVYRMTNGKTKVEGV